MINRTIGLASDHAGYPLKEQVKEWLKELGYEFVDFGTHSTDSCNYPEFAHSLAEAIEKGELTTGIAICGTGNGINMTLNHHNAIRSALCWMPEIAALARQHNDANVMVMPGRFIEPAAARECVEIFLSTPFEGGRHQARIEAIPVKK